MKIMSMLSSSSYMYVLYRINAYSSFTTLLINVYTNLYITRIYVKFTLLNKEYLCMYVTLKNIETELQMRPIIQGSIIGHVTSIITLFKRVKGRNFYIIEKSYPLALRLSKENGAVLCYARKDSTREDEYRHL